MKIGFVGLGKMGSNMVLNLLDKGHEVVVYDQDASRRKQLADIGATGASSLRGLGDLLEAPRAVWIMVPAGPAVDEIIDDLVKGLGEGDIIVDGGNSYYEDSIRRANALSKRIGIHFLDVGTSGAIKQARSGVAMTIGGRKEVFEQLVPVFEALSLPNGYAHVGPSGAGHFAKVVHNGIEHAVLEAYAEGLNLLASKTVEVDVASAFGAWSHGGVIQSWLLQLAAETLGDDPELKNFPSNISGDEMIKWAMEASIEQNVPLPAIYAALVVRYQSQSGGSLGARLISGLREKLGRRRSH